MSKMRPAQEKLLHSAPRAITMWDFSWLERRWPGAGYEDWDVALDGLKARGYDAVRIDAYPHLLAADARAEWRIQPQWNQQNWGSPTEVTLSIWPALAEFISKCAQRGIRVGLSTWFQDDASHARERIQSPQDHAAIWLATLRHLGAAGLLDNILYLDFCNEWPQSCWAPFFQRQDTIKWEHPDSLAWMRAVVAEVRSAYPEIPLTFSHAVFTLPETANRSEWTFLDLLEPHIWMAIADDMAYYRQLNYNFERFDPAGFQRLAEQGEAVYRRDAESWKARLAHYISRFADYAEETGLPLITTECWGVVDFKDGPGLDWGYVKELTAYGTQLAAETGQWVAMATSNFCGPQFEGMWSDVAWHQRLTSLIRNSR